jgi:hypothetical protein
MSVATIVKDKIGHQGAGPAPGVVLAWPGVSERLPCARWRAALPPLRQRHGRRPPT